MSDRLPTPDQQAFFKERQQEAAAALAASVEARKNEERRHVELRTSFYEKLAALNAGSLAIVASFAATLIGKSGLRSGALKSNPTWLVWIGVLLWLSLILAVAHNYLAVRIAKIEFRIAAEDAVHAALLNAMWACSNESDRWTRYEWFKDAVKAQAWTKTRRDVLEARAALTGGVAILMFLAAYTLVLISILRLWHLS